jgi:hypothetical protein
VRRLAAAFLMTTFLRQKRRVDGLNAPEPEEKREPSGHAQGNKLPHFQKGAASLGARDRYPDLHGSCSAIGPRVIRNKV